MTQRNTRHKIPAPEGRGAFSETATIAGTARINGAFAGGAFAEIARNLDWNMLDPGPRAGPDSRAFDATASGLARLPGSAPGRPPAPAAASA